MTTLNSADNLAILNSAKSAVVKPERGRQIANPKLEQIKKLEQQRSNMLATEDLKRRRRDATVHLLNELKDLQAILLTLDRHQYTVGPRAKESSIRSIITRMQTKSEHVFMTERFEYDRKKYLRITRTD